VVLVVILVAAAVVAIYGVALVNARLNYQRLRLAYCGHLVADFYARNPRLRQLPLLDACIELEQLTGEVIE